MARGSIPLLLDDTFFASGDPEDDDPIELGSVAWYNWLTNKEHRSFSLRCSSGAFTARHEQQRHGWYWYAYRKIAGKAYKLYLGKAEDLSKTRLYDVAARLAEKHTRSLPATSPLPLSSPPATQTLSFSLPPGKFSVPVSDTFVVARPHLLARLASARKKRLILLSAQTGWGKTLFLAQWCHILHSQDVPFTWISLQASDNHLQAFLHTFISALQLLQPDLGLQTARLLPSLSSPSLDDALQTLMHECLSLNRECIIFLDDIQYLTSPSLLSLLNFFLEHLPPQLQLVMACRSEPSLVLSRLRVQGKLLEIRAPDLALTTSEIQYLFEYSFHLSLTPYDYALVTQRTEGWPAGVHLVAQLLQQASDPQHALLHFSGSTYTIRDYILEEVFLPQPISIQDFLLQTSLLPQLSSPLCDAVCANTNSQAKLEYLRQHNLFVTSLDNTGSQYRYHPLFQEALQARLRQQYPSLAYDLQQRATLWFAQHAPDHSINPPEVVATPTPTLSPTLPLSLLTEREREVLTLLLRGASNREIAQHLIISEGTTKKHIANICSKFHVQRRTQVITRALESASHRESSSALS